MRTTIDLDDGVLRELKKRRSREGRTLGAIASELLASALREGDAPASPLTWTSRSMGAAVDIEDKEAVWAKIEGR